MEISARYEMTERELFRAMFAIGPVRQPVTYAVVLLAPALGGTDGFHKHNVATLVVVAVLEVFMVTVLVRAQRKQFAKVAVPTALTITPESFDEAQNAEIEAFVQQASVAVPRATGA